MAESTAQASAPATPTTRRSATLPLRLADLPDTRRSSSYGASTPDPTVETLFGHSSARIVSFQAAPTSISKMGLSKTSVSNLEEEIGTLSWTSRLERVIAVGPLRIYRAPGSVAFLNCGSVLKPIMPKTKCWCVDDASSKFVMQMRNPEYLRIEIPVPETDDLEVPMQLKEVLSQISLFEKTACPFQRSFTVDLPEAPSTPVKKRPWRPILTPGCQPDNTFFTSGFVSDGTTANEVNAVVAADIPEYGVGSDSDATDDTNVTPRNSLPCPAGLLDLHIPGTKPSDVLQASRSLTAPPQLTLITSPPSKTARERSPLRRSASRDSTSSDISSSAESFHSIQSWHSPITPLPPSPPESNPASPTMYPYSHENITLPKRSHHSRDVSGDTVIPRTPEIRHVSVDSSTRSVLDESEEYTTPLPTTPTLIDDIEDNLDEDHFEIATPTAVPRRIRHRATTGSNSQRRALSPMPPAANIFSPSRRRPRRLQTARHIPTAIIQKTCEILLSPPGHLLQLMLDIAARIRAGEWRGMVFGSGESGERIVGQWDYEVGEVPGIGFGEDDYGLPIGGNKPTRQSINSTNSVGGSWEID